MTEILNRAGAIKTRPLAERLELTEYNDLPFSTYLILSCDPCADVRYSLASNANIPVFVLKRLSEDENVYVSCRAIKTINRIESDSAIIETTTFSMSLSSCCQAS